MSEIKIALNTGEETRVVSGTTAADALATLLSNKQRKQTVAVEVDGVLADLATVLQQEVILTPVSVHSDEGLKILRHSAAHVMAQAVLKLYGPDVKVAIGPAIEDGFYYDFDRQQPFTPDDFDRIEAAMREVVEASLPFARTTVTKDEAVALFEARNETYKVELLREIETETVSLYTLGDFTDLCRGPHLPHAGWLTAFKLIKVAGAYWRGNEHNPMLQRLYGTAFTDAKGLKKYLYALEEAKKRDHRKLGRELELFTIQDQVGPGLILWQPKGAQLRRLIEDYWKEEHYRHHYELLYTPHIARRDLWKTSGREHVFAHGH
jgi:threonyl-tRNA synthetase